jgi:hypothetical protein
MGALMVYEGVEEKRGKEERHDKDCAGCASKQRTEEVHDRS